MFDPGRVGRTIRAIRIRAGLRQQDLAERARVSRSFVSKVECGRATTADLVKLQSICAALGADLDVRVRWRGEGADRLLDEGHAELVNRIVTLLVAAGWEIAIEATFSVYGERGSIDVLGFHPSSAQLLVIEIKTVVPDAQGTLMPLDRKVRLAAGIARERGWEPESVSRLLIVGEGSTNRRRVERFGDLFASALPDRGRRVRRWLAHPAGRLAGLLFLPYATKGVARRSTAGRSRVRRPKGR